jgi:hypothetical protein
MTKYRIKESPEGIYKIQFKYLFGWSTMDGIGSIYYNIHKAKDDMERLREAETRNKLIKYHY